MKIRDVFEVEHLEQYVIFEEQVKNSSTVLSDRAISNKKVNISMKS